MGDNLDGDGHFRSIYRRGSGRGAEGRGPIRNQRELNLDVTGAGGSERRLKSDLWMAGWWTG